MQKFKESENSRYVYQNELDKVCFQHDMAYADFKCLTKRTASDKILRDKAIDIARNPKYNGCQRGLASVVYKLFDKKLLLHAQTNLPLVVLKMRIFRTKN